MTFLVSDICGVVALLSDAMEAVLQSGPSAACPYGAASALSTPSTCGFRVYLLYIDVRAFVCLAPHVLSRRGDVLVSKDFLGVFADLARPEIVLHGFFSTGRIFARHGFEPIK